MNVLVDFHHSDLLESLYHLFEDRIGAKVWVPRGMQWWSEGIWQQGHELFGDAIAHQFLEAAESDELHPERTIHWVTFEEAQAMDWDVVMCSVPDNEAGYGQFARSKGARFAVQVGNVNQPVYSPDAVILDATSAYPAGVPFTPEWDWRGAFRFESVVTRDVASFVNLFPLLPCWQDMESVRALLPDHYFRVYGHSAPDGFIKPTAAVGHLMSGNGWGWHDKVTGDGFGYVIHYWASVGRPLIGHASHYRGQLAADLWEDGVTCIDLDQHDAAETAHLIQTADVAAMGEEIHRRLMARLDFAADAARVADALGLMVPA